MSKPEFFPPIFGIRELWAHVFVDLAQTRTRFGPEKHRFLELDPGLEGLAAPYSKKKCYLNYLL